MNHCFRTVVAGPAPLLPDLRPAAVTSVQVFPSGALEIRADRATNGWMLAKPVAYPAQAAAIEALLDALQKLAPAQNQCRGTAPADQFRGGPGF